MGVHRIAADILKATQAGRLCYFKKPTLCRSLALHSRSKIE